VKYLFLFTLFSKVFEERDKNVENALLIDKTSTSLNCNRAKIARIIASILEQVDMAFAAF
jgi:hypothetical protein